MIKPDRVQLNTVTRPPAESFASAINRDTMEKLAGYFDPKAEIIADFRGIHEEENFQTSRETVLQLLQRRPCTVEDISNGLGIHRNETVKYVEELLNQKAIEYELRNGSLYYKYINTIEK